MADKNAHTTLQDAMWPLISRGCGDFTPDQICRALHHALSGDVQAALDAINEKPTKKAPG